MIFIKKFLIKKYKKIITKSKDKLNQRLKTIVNQQIKAINHNIKTPILAQIQIINLLLNNRFGTMTTKQKEMLDEILNSNYFVLQTISNLLFLLNYEQEKPNLKLEKINISKTVENAISLIENYAKEKSQNIIFKNLVAKETNILADKKLIEKIIINLLNSSISYGFENSDIQISIKESKNNICFCAKNKSIYMTKEKIKSLFKENNDNLSDYNQLGMNINLNIANKLIKAHNWNIIASSKKNNSSVFGFVVKK